MEMGCFASCCSDAWRSMLLPNIWAKPGTAAPRPAPITRPGTPNKPPRRWPACAPAIVAAMLGACSASAAGTWLMASPAAGSKPRSSYAFLTFSRLTCSGYFSAIVWPRSKPRLAASSGLPSKDSIPVRPEEMTFSNPLLSAAPIPVRWGSGALNALGNFCCALASASS